MKRYIFLIISLVLFISSFKTNGQVLITKNDSIPLGQDTIVNIILPGTRGDIQWQKSLDSKNWIDIEGKNNDTISVKTDIEALYRAIVTDGTCLPVISDSIGLVTGDSITKNYVNPSTLGFELISDSTDISDGNYIYTGTNNSNGFEIGRVIIDEQSGGKIRRITELLQNGDTTVTKTEQATMEDLFINTSFKLSTDMIYPTQNLKSANFMEVEKAVTDDEGFIHPVEVYYSSKDGTLIKSASIFTEEKNLQGGPLFMYKDFSGVNLFDKQGTFTYKNEFGQSISVTGIVKSYIKEGHFKFDPTFKFDYKFERPKVDLWPLDISAGELKSFEFYSDNAQIESKSVIITEWNAACILGKEWVLMHDILPPTTLKFPVGGIYVWITFTVDLNCKVSAKLGTGSSATVGYYNTNKITLGARYENKDWKKIEEFKQGTEIILPESLYGNIELKFEVFPIVKVKIYDVFGPFLKIGPNITYNFQTSVNQQNWDNSLDFRADLSVGVAVDILGKKVLSYSPEPWHTDPINLYKSPKNLLLIDGDNQTGQTGKELEKPVVIKVTNSNDQPVDNVKVYFSLNSGSVSESMVKSNSDGIAQTNWILSSSPGSQSLDIAILDGKDQIIPGCSFTINATATSSSLPSVITNSITNLTQTSATLNGNVTSDGGTTITARGFYWSETDQTPDSGDNKETVSGTTGSFIKSITGLQSNTTYYYRAFATNSEGTSTGEVQQFITNQNLSIPAVTTNAITDITQTTATSGGNVTSDGGATVTARGVCWSTSPNPTTANSKTTNGIGTGSFTSNINGLTANTPYYVRAYAINSAGTSYGDEVTLTTTAAEGPVYGSFTDPRDGNVYKTVTIGEQVWMAENLAYLPAVSPPTYGSYTEPFYYVYGYTGSDVSTAKQQANYTTYGVLYNWPAAFAACPAGWHLPSDAEWIALIDFLIADDNNYDGTLIGNKIAKSMTATTNWASSTIKGAVGNTDYPAYRNKTGFSGLPGGYRGYDALYHSMGLASYWWSSTENGTNNAKGWGISNYSVNISPNGNYTQAGYSVRCIKD